MEIDASETGAPSSRSKYIPGITALGLLLLLVPIRKSRSYSLQIRNRETLILPPVLGASLGSACDLTLLTNVLIPVKGKGQRSSTAFPGLPTPLS